MINLIIKDVFENRSRIDSIVKHINKVDKRYCLMFLLMTAELYITAKVVIKNQEKINNLELKLEEMKSKGE